MMPGPRWKKVLSDLWSHKTRTLLVVASIFIGVFATGVINAARSIVVGELQASYRRTMPAHATISVSDEDSFGDDMINTIRRMDGVAEAEGRRVTRVGVENEPDRWEDFSLTAIPDFDDIRINKITPVRGASSPRDKEVLIERSSMEMLHARIGDRLLIERSDGKRKLIQIAGVVHDLAVRPTSMSGTFYGYVTPGTMEWLGEKPDYTRVLLRAAPAQGIALQAGMVRMMGREGQVGMPTIMRVVDEVYAKIKKSDRDPQAPRGPHGRPSNEHWATSFINTLSGMMNVLGVMSLFLSGFLVTNTISALLAQQTRQIGIMKAIGARNRQIMVMFLVLVLGFGLLALLVALPLTMAVTQVFVNYVADYFNFDLSQADFPRHILFIQAFASLVIPVIAALLPVFMGTRITVHQALNSDSIQQTPRKKQKKQRKIKEPRPSLLSRGLAALLNRPLLLSVHNTFRRRARVTLTLLTLTMGGLIFIGIFTIRNSLIQTLDDLIAREFQFDIALSFDRSYRDYHVLDEIMRVPGVVVAESWTNGSAKRIYADGLESEDISMTAVPPGSQMINPRLVAGRWLLPEDENALVVSTGVLEDDPDIAVGDWLTLSINERETRWQVVGISTGIGDSREAYAPYSHYTRVIGEVGKTRMVRLQAKDRSLDGQFALAEVLEEHLERQGIGVSRTFFMNDMRRQVIERFNFVVMALMVMALLMAIVGGLGLAGTMSLNVIERTKEIGIMRAIGASTPTMIQIFLGEGLLIGVLSWLLGASLSLPLSKLLTDAMGMAFFSLPLSFRFSTMAVMMWLGISVVLAILASFLPAWNASRVPVRDVLAYE